MSGKRQHFIPRFLLEGFASQRSGEEVFAWVYRKDRPPFNTNTRNIGVEGSFYNDGSDSEADDLITTGEQTFSALVARLRETPGPIQDSDGIATLIAHFEIRTRHIRQSYTDAAGSLLERMLCDETQPLLVQQMLRSLANDPSPIKEALSEELRKHGAESLAEPIYEMVKPNLPQVLPLLLTQLPLVLSQMRLQLPEALAGGAKRGHIDALKKTLAPRLRVDRYKKLDYQVVKVPSASIPLGDSVVVFQKAGERPFKPILDTTDELLGVYLPISADTVVVGSLQPSHSPPDLAALPEVIARCSLEFFVAKSPPEDATRLTEDIGAYTGLLSSGDMNTLLANILGDLGGD